LSTTFTLLEINQQLMKSMKMEHLLLPDNMQVMMEEEMKKRDQWP
jgi:hypothetical protein